MQPKISASKLNFLYHLEFESRRHVSVKNYESLLGFRRVFCSTTALLFQVHSVVGGTRTPIVRGLATDHPMQSVFVVLGHPFLVSHSSVCVVFHKLRCLTITFFNNSMTVSAKALL